MKITINETNEVIDVGDFLDKGGRSDVYQKGDLVYTISDPVDKSKDILATLEHPNLPKVEWLGTTTVIEYGEEKERNVYIMPLYIPAKNHAVWGPITEQLNFFDWTVRGWVNLLEAVKEFLQRLAEETIVEAISLVEIAVAEINVKYGFEFCDFNLMVDPKTNQLILLDILYTTD